MNTQQGFARTWIIIASFITLLIASLWLWADFRNQNSNHYQVVDERVSVATSTDETAGWKTYRNDEYGFEFKYDTGFKIGDVTNSNQRDVHLIINSELSSSSEIWGSKQMSVIVLPYACDDKENDEVLKIGNMNYYVKYRDLNPASKIYRVEKDNQCYVLSAGLFKKDISTKTNFSDIYFNTELRSFDHVVQSFKFIDPIDTSDWKTYRNEEYGFEFKYPSFYKISFESSELITFQNSAECVRLELEGQGKEVSTGCRSLSVGFTNKLRQNREGEEGGITKVDGIPTYVVTRSDLEYFEYIASVPANPARDDQFYSVRIVGTAEQATIARKEFDQLLSTFKFTN